MVSRPLSRFHENSWVASVIGPRARIGGVTSPGGRGEGQGGKTAGGGTTVVPGCCLGYFVFCDTAYQILIVAVMAFWRCAVNEVQQ